MVRLVACRGGNKKLSLGRSFCGTLNITDNLTPAGVRYTEEDKSADAQTWLNSTAQAWLRRPLIRLQA